jgi:hypothetical protein
LRELFFSPRRKDAKTEGAKKNLNHQAALRVFDANLCASSLDSRRSSITSSAAKVSERPAGSRTRAPEISNKDSNQMALSVRLSGKSGFCLKQTQLRSVI